MRYEHLLLIGVLLLILITAILVGVTVTFLTYDKSPYKAAEKIEASTTSSIPTTTSSIMESSRTSSMINIESTTTTSIPDKYLEIVLSETELYRKDDVTVTVLARDLPVSGVTLTVDGVEEFVTDSRGEAVIYDLGGGDHVITGWKDGFLSETVSFSVDPVRFGLSSAVKKQSSVEERAALKQEGKVVLLFYDRPNCPNCLRMKPWVADIVEMNRDCVSYELLRIIYDGPRNELKLLFPDQTFVDTPVVVVDGPAGRSVSEGFSSRQALIGRVRAASDGRCRIV